MIYVCTGKECNLNVATFIRMFELRSKEFYYKKGWNVNVVDGLEIDEYDSENTVYIISMIGDEVVGSARFRCTVGKHMQNDVFSAFFGNTKIQSPNIWEITRHCIDSDAPPASRSLAARELALSAYEVGLAQGWTQYLATIERPNYGLYKRYGADIWVIDQGNSPHGDVILVLGNISQELLVCVREKTGLKKAVENAPLKFDFESDERPISELMNLTPWAGRPRIDPVLARSASDLRRDFHPNSS